MFYKTKKSNIIKRIIQEVFFVHCNILSDKKMSLKQTISIENFGDKNYQIRLIDDIEHKAILTHYLHNYKNGLKKHFQKDALKTLRQFIDYKQ